MSQSSEEALPTAEHLKTGTLSLGGEGKVPNSTKAVEFGDAFRANGGEYPDIHGPRLEPVNVGEVLGDPGTKAVSAVVTMVHGSSEAE